MIFKQSFRTLAVLFTVGIGQYGCMLLPPNSRTATIHDVRIDEALSYEDLRVQPGDEVRFVNLRKEDVRIEIPNLKRGDLTCEREFSNWAGFVGENTVLKPNASASLCFKRPIVVKYMVRMITALAGSDKILKGVVTVEQVE